MKKNMTLSRPTPRASHHQALSVGSTSERAESAQMLTKYGTRQTCAFLTMLTIGCMRAAFSVGQSLPAKDDDVLSV